MLPIIIPATECWDDAKEEFVSTAEVCIEIEHSLASISEWEIKYKKPFLHSERSLLETMDYVQMMTISPIPKPDLSVYTRLTRNNLSEIEKYLNDPHTATWFRNEPKTATRNVITSEVVFYWMFSNQIPIECQYWNFNRLITLIRVFDDKNRPPKKLSNSELYNRNRAINAARRKKLNSKG